MARSLQGWSDVYVEHRVSVLLQWGVTLSATMVVLGGSIYLTQNAQQMTGEHLFRGEPANLREIPGIVRGAFQMKGASLIQVGVLMLILTPMARVAFSVWAFWKQRDRLYVAVTLIVLVILIHGLLAIH